MDIRPLAKTVFWIAAAALAAAGCSNPNQIPTLGPDDQKAIDAYNKMTPQQRIDSIEKGPMPQSAKQAMIQRIKDQNGIK